MKKTFSFLLLTIMLMASNAFPQAVKDNWNLGFGAVYPKYVGTDIFPGEFSYGGFLSIQRDFSENIGFRTKASYVHLTGDKKTSVKNDAIALGFDLIYNMFPCETFVTPYIGVGTSALYFTLNQSTDPKLDKSHFDYQLNFLFGAKWNLFDSEDWFLKTELAYHNTANDKFDGLSGTTGNNGLLGGTLDSYMNFELGLIYMLDKGEKSKMCDMYNGLSVDAKVDYDRIEDIIKKYTSKPADVDYNKIEDIVKKHAGKTTVQHTDGDKNWVLIGVNFDFAKSTLSSESYPILANAAQVLLSNPSMKVEIQGHTDNIGSASSNKKLSLARAETVKSFLLSKGVEASRLSTVGLGDSKPISDNKTAQGRSFNRRIEFKILK